MRLHKSISLYTTAAIQNYICIAPDTTLEGWVSRDTRTVQKENSTSVAITTIETDRIVAADAILLIPEKK